MWTVLQCDNTITYTNIMAIIEKFIVLNKINYIYIAPSQNKFIWLVYHYKSL